MGLIIKNLKIRGNEREGRVACLFDTGCSENLIREDVAKRFGTVISLVRPVEFRMADGEAVLEAKKAAILFISIDGCEIIEKALVVEKLSDEMLIGTETMQVRKIKLDLENEKVTMDPKAARLRV